MKRLILISFFFQILFTGKSQTIENVDFKYIDEKILIFYDLIDCTAGNKYEVEIKFSDDKGLEITPRSLSGDFGVITCGKNKKAIWDLFQEVEKFEGNYRAIINIVNTLNTKGKVVEESSPRKLRIVKSEKDGDQIITKLNMGKKRNVYPEDLFFVSCDKNIVNTSGETVRKIGKLKITETQKNSSKGILLLNNGLKYEQIYDKLQTSNLSKFNKYNIFAFASSILIQSRVESIYDNYYFEYGFGIVTSTKENDYSFGFKINRSRLFVYSFYDLSLFLVINPYYFNSKFFSLGIDIHPIPIKQDLPTLSYTTRKLEIKPKIDLSSGFQFNRIKLKVGLDCGNINYLAIYSYSSQRDSYSSIFRLYTSISFSLFK